MTANYNWAAASEACRTARADARALRDLPMARPAPDTKKRTVPGLRLARGVRMRTCGDGCNGCDECTDHYCGDEYGDGGHAKAAGFKVPRWHVLAVA